MVVNQPPFSARPFKKWLKYFISPHLYTRIVLIADIAQCSHKATYRFSNAVVTVCSSHSLRLIPD